MTKIAAEHIIELTFTLNIENDPIESELKSEFNLKFFHAITFFRFFQCNLLLRFSLSTVSPLHALNSTRAVFFAIPFYPINIRGLVLY